MPSVYQTVFGGSLVAPAIPTYLALNISANAVLGWPLESNITSPAVAEIIDVTATVPALTVQLSDARQVGTGYCALFNNVGANTFTLLDAQGNALMAPAPGQAWQIYLADNSTLQGTWRVFQYGAGVSNANAASLAGNGLKAIATTLNERIAINAQAANYVIGSGFGQDRASCIEWTGGSGGTFTAPAPATVGADWFCYIKNSGTGALTLSGTIDGSVGKSFNPNDSCILVSDGANLFTMGFGQSVASSFNFVTISLAGASGTVVLTGAQLNRISYKFTGALAGNTIVQVPASIQQYWVDNETTGAFTLTISAGAGSTFTVPQANRTILYCDGLNIVNAISSGAVQFADGTAAAPSITFASDTGLGFYKAGVDVLGVSTAGVQRVTVGSAGGVTVNAPSSGAVLNLNGAGAGASLGTFGNANATGFANVIFQNDTVKQLVVGVGGSTAGGFSQNQPHISTLTNDPLAVATNGLVRITIGAAGAVTINAPTSGAALTFAGVAAASPLITFNAGATAATSLLAPAADTTVYSLLGRSQAGPGIQGRWDSGSTNRYLSFGNYSNAGGYTEGFRILEGGTIQFSSGGTAGSSLLVPSAQTVVFSLLGLSNVFGPGMQARWDSGTNNRFLDLGIYDNSSVFTSMLRIAGPAGLNVSGFGPLAAALVDMTPDTGTFLGTLTGGATAPTVTVRFARSGNLVVLNIPKQTFISNSNNFTITGMPLSLAPTNAIGSTEFIPLGPMTDNGVEVTSCFATVANTGNIVLYKGGSVAASWTAVATKGIGSLSNIYGSVISYNRI